MSGFLHTITGFLAENPHLAYAAVLLLAMSESLPVVGAFIPGSAVIIALAALVPSGTLKLWPLLAAAIVGAIIGDGLAFWIGHRYHREILGRWPLNRQPDLVARSENFFARHGNMSVFIARFMPGVRAVVPLFAGILRMPVWRFYVTNVFSAIVWAPSHILPGVLVGASLGAFGTAAEPLAIGAVLLIVIAWLLLHALRLAIRRGYPVVERWLDRARSWALARDSRPARGVAALLDPDKPGARGLLLLAILLGGAAWLFLGILEDVVNGDPLVTTDAAIFRALQDLRSAPGDAVMTVFTELGDTVVVIAMTAAVFLYLAWRRAWRTAGYWLAAVAGASALNTVIKLTLHRSRPGAPFYTGASAFSFPSGHSTTNMALYGFLAFLIARELRPALRPVVGFAAFALVFMIALSRLYLGAHWFSDVVAGLAFGTLWLSALMISYVRGPAPTLGAGRLIAVSVMALAIAGGANVYRHHALDMSRYAVALPSGESMPVAQWLGQGWQQLPAHRVDIGGEDEEPLTLQWAGGLDSLAAQLRSKGWQRPPPLTPAGSLGFFASGVSSASLPVLPSFNGGQLPELVLVRETGPGRRLVLRLWSTALDVGTTTPVWAGSVVEEQVQRRLGLINLIGTGEDSNVPRDAVAGALPGGQMVTRNLSAPGWDGRVWLGRASP